MNIINNVLDKMSVFFWAYRYFWGPALLVVITYPFWSTILEFVDLGIFILKAYFDKNRRLVYFFDALQQNHEKTKWYLDGNHLVIFVSDDKGTVLLEERELSKKEMRRLDELGHLKNAHEFIVDGFERYFNY